MHGIRINKDSEEAPPHVWNEVFHANGNPRAQYAPLLERFSLLGPSPLRQLDESLEATMREMGVTFSIPARSSSGKPWECDLLPQIFEAAEWAGLVRGISQRLRAFELFLRDIYGNKEILRDGVLPVQAALGSPYYQRAAFGLPRPEGSFLFLSGVALSRTRDGTLAVRHHYFSNASGISYMIQNRRALSRVMTNFFEGHSIRSIADAPTDILEGLRGHSGEMDPTVVLLSPGQGSPAFAEHAFLGRRMGIPVVQGSDLLVHEDRVFLKTITGLELVEVIYSRLADPWLDPLVFLPESLIGVPGLVQCIRKGTVTMVNAIGSQVADDRALLPFAGKIVRYYLSEEPLLPSIPTYWLGDIDQRELILSEPENYTIRPLYGERILTPPPGVDWPPEEKRRALREVGERASGFVAQPRDSEALTVCFENGKPAWRLQDHIVFALRAGNAWEVFPGALTRTATANSPFVSSELGGGSKDTWVEMGEDPGEVEESSLKVSEHRPVHGFITSRMAESCYWVGRYLERAVGLANMIGTIEALEAEELNPSEQKLYRPVWNRMLPPLENRDVVHRRSLSSPKGRYFLTLDPRETGTVATSIFRAGENARAVLEALSVEAASVLAELDEIFVSTRFQPRAGEKRMSAVAARICRETCALVPRFFGVADATMVVDGGWRFCLLGQMIERAVITANALATISHGFPARSEEQAGEHATEIRLSAFLRLLSSRDAYRRIYQMRIEPASVAELLWDNPAVPRAVRFCLDRAVRLLEESGAAATAAGRKTLHEIGSVQGVIRHTDWEDLCERAIESAARRERGKSDLEEHSDRLLGKILGMHTLIADGFLNHQIHLREEPQPFLKGIIGHGI